MTYKAKRNIKYNGVDYVKGDTIVFENKADAEILLEDRAITSGEVSMDAEIPSETAPTAPEKDEDEETTDDEENDADKVTPGFEKHVVTSDDLDNNPELEEKGTKIGDTIEIPIVESKDEVAGTEDSTKTVDVSANL